MRSPLTPSSSRAGDPIGHLRAILRHAASEGFSRVMEPGLGESLGAAWSACGALGAGDPGARERFSAGLQRWSGLGRQDRRELIALGQRLCLGHSAAAGGPARGAQRVTPNPRAAFGRPRPEPRPAAPPSGSASVRLRQAGDAGPSRGTSREPAGSGGATEGVDPRDLPVTCLAGVGGATAARLQAKGLHTLEDLIGLLPASYIDHRDRLPPQDWTEGQVVTFEARVVGLRQGFAKGRSFATMELDVPGQPKPCRVQARWFGATGGLSRWTAGTEVLAVGLVRSYAGQAYVVHPQLRPPGGLPLEISPRYPAVEGVPPATLTKLIQRALDRVLAGEIPEVLPEDLRVAQLLPGQPVPSRRAALEQLHRPAAVAKSELDEMSRGASGAHARLVLEDLFWIQLRLAKLRAGIQAGACSVTVAPQHMHPGGLAPCLPFAPTSAQIRVVGEIGEDLGRSVPMMRLLQGDVGSGKTMVAFAAALGVAKAGGQTAVMAPTEILAQQHLRTLTPWCEKAGLRLGLLTGAVASGPRESLVALCAAGQIDVLVGTHALLTEDVGFARLGLVVVDEQHRFGVEQRARLRNKGQQPHLLVMTATPIPRSLALTAYGELDVSVIDELPPGRQTVRTVLWSGAKALEEARARLAEAVRGGAQAFVVCPLVEASETLQVSDVEATAAALRQGLPEHAIGVIHGRMAARDKDRIMARFRRGELAVLVATTVIEVGVDVPEATAILVEHAERFGLAQLHQLRGRVGRGAGQAVCWLHTSQGAQSEAAQRLRVLAEHSDGFAVAEKDLELRGPGEVFGVQQSGAPRLRFAGLGGQGLKLLLAARQAARTLVERDPELREGPWARELARRQLKDAELAAAAG